MGQRIHIESRFAQTDGKLITDSGASVDLGPADSAFAPYELLLGGLSYCLFSTFVSIAEKMQLAYEGVDMQVTGVKRDEKVATLKTCTIEAKAKGVQDQEKFKKAFEISTRYCSVFQTISKVADMEWNIEFA
jgi:putative redox protein